MSRSGPTMKRTPRAEPSLQQSRPADREIHSELAELRDMVKTLSSRITALAPPSPAHTHRSRGGLQPAPRNQPAADPVITYLCGYGINQETAQVVARFTRDTIETTQNLNATDLTVILKAAIARLFSTERLLEERLTRPRRISLIGPTGVGKTTTLAKIAAHYLSRFGNRIA
jgi:flagellar biosynthesis protein FlhF